MDIHAINPAELEALLALYRDLHTDEEAVGIHEARKTWQEILENPRIRYFGAYLDGELVGSCNITVIPNLTRRCRPYGLIENVVTRRDKRRQGIGTALLGQALEFAWSVDCYKVMLMTGRLDESTFAFYEAAGFDRHGKQGFIARPGR